MACERWMRSMFVPKRIKPLKSISELPATFAVDSAGVSCRIVLLNKPENSVILRKNIRKEIRKDFMPNLLPKNLHPPAEIFRTCRTSPLRKGPKSEPLGVLHIGGEPNPTSSIEVDNKVYEFIVGDLSHPKSEEIYAILEELSPLLKAHGYIPQAELVLHDLEKREKEQALRVHSEKLAIAFGLINTRPGSAIKIMKNLRVCTDCHTVTKLLSKITGRKIIVRDRNRFHQFMDGSCSCGDY